MVTAAKPKSRAGTGTGTSATTTARARTAKAPTAAWSRGTFVFKGNGKVLLEESITYKQMATIWNRIPGLIAKNGPGKYNVSIETTA